VVSGESIIDYFCQGIKDKMANLYYFNALATHFPKIKPTFGRGKRE
jgi:hypothetical protein